MILRGFWCHVLPTLLVTACQATAEIELLLPPAPEVLPISAWADADGFTLRWILKGPSSPLGPDDRVRVGDRVLRLRQLQAADVQVSQLQASGQVVPAPITSLAFRQAAAPVHVALVLDNSAAAAGFDYPEQWRVIGAQGIVDGVLCSAAPCVPDGDITLVVLEGDRTEVRASRSRDSRALEEALKTLPQDAGGTAPLWSGLQQALAALRPRGSAGSAAIVLYSLRGVDPSYAPAPQALLQTLAEQPPAPLFAVQHDGQAEDLRGPVEASGGALLAADAHRDLDGAFAAARCALAGAWEAQVRAALPGDARRLQGELRLRVASETRSAAFDLPLLRRPQ